MTSALLFARSPSRRYLLVALVVTCFYSLLTALASLKLVSGSFPATRTLFLLVLLDVVSAFFVIFKLIDKLEEYIPFTQSY